MHFEQQLKQLTVMKSTPLFENQATGMPQTSDNCHVEMALAQQSNPILPTSDNTPFLEMNPVVHLPHQEVNIYLIVLVFVNPIVF